MLYAVYIYYAKLVRNAPTWGNLIKSEKHSKISILEKNSVKLHFALHHIEIQSTSFEMFHVALGLLKLLLILLLKTETLLNYIAYFLHFVTSFSIRKSLLFFNFWEISLPRPFLKLMLKIWLKTFSSHYSSKFFVNSLTITWKLI